MWQILVNIYEVFKAGTSGASDRVKYSQGMYNITFCLRKFCGYFPEADASIFDDFYFSRFRFVSSGSRLVAGS